MNLHSFETTERAPIRRSLQDNSFNVSTSFPTGFLVPLGWVDICPASTFRGQLGGFSRMGLTPLKPVMDRAYTDSYAFYVPYRILWKGFVKVYGEGEPTEWDTPTETTVPYFDPSTPGLVDKFRKYSIFDYLGYNIDDTSSRKLSILPLLAYVRVWEDFFRDANLQSKNPGTSVLFEAASGSDQSANVLTLINYMDQLADTLTNTRLYKLNRYHDYFSSALPRQQLGDAITFGIGGEAPIISRANGGTGSKMDYIYTGFYISNGNNIPADSTVGVSASSSDDLANTGYYNSFHLPADGSLGGGTMRTYLSGAGQQPRPFADLSQATPVSVSDLRYAIALQALAELDARCGGLRYNTSLKGHFGTAPLDETLQRPELLGATHYELGMTTVTNNSANGTGSLGAYSATSDFSGMFHKSFKEPGILIFLSGVRVKHRYSQGEGKAFYKTRRYDWYDPLLNNISEQPVYTREIFSPGGDNVFGFQEAWAEYRFQTDKCTGGMRKGAYADLNAWNYGDYYTSAPLLSGTWMKEDPKTIGQTLTGFSDTDPDILCSMILFDGHIDLKAVLPMTKYSRPMLLDR